MSVVLCLMDSILQLVKVDLPLPFNLSLNMKWHLWGFFGTYRTLGDEE